VSRKSLLECFRRIQALAQNGLAYSRDPYDMERLEELQVLVAEGMSLMGAGDMHDWAAVIKAEKGYATPKLDVRGAVFRDEQILLVRERSDGKWTLPGGWIDVNESPSESIAKEVKEESGFVVKATKLVAIQDRRKHAHPPMFFHVYKLFFLCELLGGKASNSLETDGVGFYPENGLPELSTARVTESQIQMLFCHKNNAALPTQFD